MDTLKSNIKKKLSSAIENFVDTELIEWPPGCLTFAYQPVRPDKIDMNTFKEDTN